MSAGCQEYPYPAGNSGSGGRLTRRGGSRKKRNSSASVCLCELVFWMLEGAVQNGNEIGAILAERKADGKPGAVRKDRT